MGGGCSARPRRPRGRATERVKKDSERRQRMKTRVIAVVVGLLTAGALAIPTGGGGVANASVYSRLNAIQKRILSGFASTELTQSGASARVGTLTPAGPTLGSSYFPSGS